MRILLDRATCLPRFRELYRTTKGIPVVGAWARALARSIFPEGTRITLQVGAGIGEGLSLSVDPRYEDSYVLGAHEAPVQNLLARHLKPGDVFYDVGAHIGFLSLIAARLVGKEGEVFAFEADPENARRTEGHAQMNGLEQVHVISVAVWSSCGSLRFGRALAQSSRNTGAVLQSPEVSNESDSVEVPAVTLDSFVRAHRAPDLIKVDVEGGEIEVLRGAERVFGNGRPVLLCEVHSPATAEFAETWLTERGYVWEWTDSAARFPRHIVGCPC